MKQSDFWAFLGRFRPAAKKNDDGVSDAWAKDRRVRGLLFLIVLLAAGLRLINISTETYWGDEVMSLDIVTHFDSAAETVRYIREVEFHPPLYYLMLRPWVDAFGTGAGATRSLSLVFSLANVVVAFFLGRALFRRPAVGLAAAFFMAILPIQIEYGQEARPYSMVCFAATLAVLALWQHLRRGSWRWAAIYALATLFGLYLNYSYILVALATTGWWLIELGTARPTDRWRLFRNFLLINGAVFVAFYPWLDALLSKMMLSGFMIFGTPRFVEEFRSVGLIDEVVNLLFWVNKESVLSHTLTVVELVAKTTVLAVALVFAYRLGRKGDDGRWQLRPVLFLCWLGAALFFLFVVSPMSVAYAPLYVRHVVFFTAVFAVLLAAALVSLGRRGLLIGAFLAVTLVPSIISVVGDDSTWDYQHRLAVVAEFVAEQAVPGDLVIVNHSAVRSDFAHFIPEEIPVVGLVPLNYFGQDIWSSRATLGFVENESQIRGYRSNDGAGLPDDGSHITKDAVWRKLDYLTATSEPRRIWLYGINDDDKIVHSWFAERGWRRAFPSLGRMFSLDMYVLRDVPADQKAGE